MGSILSNQCPELINIESILTTHEFKIFSAFHAERMQLCFSSKTSFPECRGMFCKTKDPQCEFCTP